MIKAYIYSIRNLIFQISFQIKIIADGHDIDSDSSGTISFIFKMDVEIK